MKSTGERLIPKRFKTKEDYIQFLRHEFAYLYVKNKLNGTDTVIEVGFGEGYGTSILAQACKSIVGIDVDAASVSHANSKYGTENCRFVGYDGHRIPFADGQFDAAISFQVIEHIKDDIHFASEISRVVKPGGKAFITTPNKTYRLKPGQKPWNRYHIREYYPEELAAVLQDKFSKVEILGISGNEDIQKIEINRVKTGPLLDFAAKVGIRKILPERFDYLIAVLISRIKGGRTKNLGNEDFLHRYKSSDFRVHGENVKSSLDLLAICTK